MKNSSWSFNIFLLSIASGVPQAAGSDPFEHRVSQAAAYFSQYQQAQRHWGEGDLEQAMPLLEKLTAAYRLDPLMIYRQARGQDWLGQHEQAIAGYQAALDLGFTDSAWIAHRIATLHAGLGQNDQAMDWLEKALQLGYGDRPGMAGDERFEALSGRRFDRITGALPKREMDRTEGWLFDLDYLLEEARRLHAGPDRPAQAPPFIAAADALKSEIPVLDNDAILRRMSQLLMMLGDGHTGIYGVRGDTPLAFRTAALPVLFYQFSDGLFIVNATQEYRRWVGARVHRFGPLPAAEVVGRLDELVKHDNPRTHLWLGVHFAMQRSAALYQTLGASEVADAVTLMLETPDGEMHPVEVRAGNHEFLRKLRPPMSVAVPPRWLQKIDEAYSLEAMAGLDALYWQFNQVRDRADGPGIAQFAQELRTRLEASQARHLIIDVRHNNGGNTNLIRPLLRVLAWWEQDGPARRIFVVMGRNTFSAAQNFISRIEQWTDAIFVGEPSSSSPNFTGEETGLLLPYSKVIGSISNRYWQNAEPGDRRPWIAPQVPISLSSQDYFGGRDPALAAIGKIISAGSD